VAASRSRLGELTLVKEVSLPRDLKAKAFVFSKNQQSEFWEKTLVVELDPKRKVLSTMDGSLKARLVINHSAAFRIWYELCKSNKDEDYLNSIKRKLAEVFNVNIREVALIATAVDVSNKLVVVTEEFRLKKLKILVTALITAGAKTNALRTGVDEGWYLNEVYLKEYGTVNVILFTNLKLTEAAMARAIITVTEAKTAAFQDLNVLSSYTPKVLATGTGTDSVVVVSGIYPPLVNYTGGHSKVGELIGKAVYKGVKEALLKDEA